MEVLMKKSITLFTTLIFSVFLGFADQSIELLSSEYQPFSGEKGNTMWCDIVNSAFAKEGITVTWKTYPIERIKDLVATGANAAFLAGTLVVKDEEKSSFLMNADPMIYLSVVAFYPEEKYPSGLGIKDAADLKGKIVGVIQGTGSAAVLQKANVQIDPATDAGMLVSKLIVGRYDVALVGDLVGLNSLRELYPDKAGNYKYDMVYTSPIDLIFSKKFPGSAEIKAKYNSGIAKIKADGTFMKILKKYYPKGNVNKSILPKGLQ